VRRGDVADRGLDPRQRDLALVLAQLPPGQPQVLAMAELAARAQQVSGDGRHGGYSPG
jgi:hypothetical protein